jgi:signal transduction histidine kinase
MIASEVSDETLQMATLLTSELVTNSVRHSDSDWVEVAITVRNDTLRIEVSDPGSPTVHPRTPDGDGGWGLMLVEEIATRWGVETLPAGKTVWADLDMTPSAKK